MYRTGSDESSLVYALCILYAFAGDHNMPVFCVHVSHFVSLDYLIYNIWKREDLISSRDVSQCWCSGPLMNSCSLYSFQLRFFTGFLTGCWQKQTLTYHVAIRRKPLHVFFWQVLLFKTSRSSYESDVAGIIAFWSFTQKYFA